MPLPHKSEEFVHKEFLKYQIELEKALAKLHKDTEETLIAIITRNADDKGIISKYKIKKIVDEYMESELRDYRKNLMAQIKLGIDDSSYLGMKATLGSVAHTVNITSDKWQNLVTGVKKSIFNKVSPKDGLTLSDRVWKVTDDNVYQLKKIITSDILQGRSAGGISRDIRGYLRQPETLRGEAKDLLQPGQGVYKSAYKNALRVARTESADAYASAQTKIAQQFGYKVQVNLSKSHPEEDICDDYDGEIFDPNENPLPIHPNCLCFYTTVLPETIGG